MDGPHWGVSGRLRALCPPVVIMALLAMPAISQAEPALRVAVAASFAGALEDLAEAYREETGVRLVPSAASSGKHFAQIRQGAPFDVFLSADVERARRLEEAGHVAPGSRRTYAYGRLVLWSRNPDYVDEAGAVLAQGDYRRLALANPRLAPYGVAARQVLEAQGLWEMLERQGRLVRGESVGHAFHFVHTGAAELGFVSLAQVRGQGDRGSTWEPPAKAHDPIEQQAVVIKDRPDTEAAQAFLDWLTRSEAAAELIRKAGFIPPEEGDAP